MKRALGYFILSVDMCVYLPRPCNGMCSGFATFSLRFPGCEAYMQCAILGHQLRRFTLTLPDSLEIRRLWLLFPFESGEKIQRRSVSTIVFGDFGR
jgi:hypothetical protein